MYWILGLGICLSSDIRSWYVNFLLASTVLKAGLSHLSNVVPTALEPQQDMESLISSVECVINGKARFAAHPSPGLAEDGRKDNDERLRPCAFAAY